MNMQKRNLSRREFLIASACAGAAMLAGGCERGQKAVPIPPSTVAARSVNTPLAQAGKTSLPKISAGSPDLILKNGHILTIDAANSEVQAVAIKDGLIQAVGTDAIISKLAGDKTQIIDVGQRVVTPGLIDPHIHVRAAGMNHIYYQPLLPPDVIDMQGLQRAIKDLLKGKPAREWMQAYYLMLKDGVPKKEDLDAVSPNNPVFLYHISGHWGVANSAALKTAGISAATKDPPGGTIERDAKGEPTGVLYNHRAMDLLRKSAPPITDEIVSKGILAVQPLLAAAGVTSFHDNNIRDVDTINIYRQLSQEGKLFLRNDLYYTLEWPADLDKAQKITPFTDALAHFSGFKFLIDGSALTAYCHQAHEGSSWNMPTWDPAMYKKAVRTLHDLGLQISVHCIGDAAVDLTLDAFEEAQNANPRPDPRHRIEHAILTTPQATRRMKDLGVVMSANPQFIFLFGDGYERLFSKSIDRIMVMREWLESVHLTIGSDAPSMPWYTPQATIAGAMSRITYSKKVIGADQTLKFEEALRAHTIGAAYADHDETVKGSLEVGKFADIAVWSQDPTKASIEELFKMAPMYMTLVGGKVVHQG